MAVGPLERKIKALIQAQGPLSLAVFMAMALQDPEHGYYRVRDSVGRHGDFITAPEISQLFGEMIGVWCAEQWRRMGRPRMFALVELGPGRGTMMRDILRATAHVAGFHAAMRLHLVESNRLLQGRQMESLKDFHPVHIDDPQGLPDLPTILVANEFFDALPARQFEKTFGGWQERMVAVQDDLLCFVLRPLAPAEAVLVPADLRDAKPDTVFEFSTDGATVMRMVARHMRKAGGAALIVDYGYGTCPRHATAQAVNSHARVDFLARPGEVDLTTHVDFAMLKDVAVSEGCAVAPLKGQGAFLIDLGIALRADMLAKNMDPRAAAKLQADMQRLVGDDQMGTLFKVLEITAT